MPIQTVKCEMCGNEVTKRSTLSLESLGASGGRACRSHDEVRQLVEVFERKQQYADRTTKANASFAILARAALLRTMCTLHNLPPEAIYARFRYLGMSEHEISDVRKQVDELGGPIIPQAEMLASVLSIL